MPENATELARGISEVVDRELPCLLALTEEQASKIPAGTGTWTAKEELGHLVDSAANNHMRFVLGAIGPAEFRGEPYAQEAWVGIHGYGQMPWLDLVETWLRINLLLARVAERVPEGRLEAPCFIGNAPPVPLRFVIADYVRHMQHHLDHLLSRERITPYP